MREYTLTSGKETLKVSVDGSGRFLVNGRTIEAALSSGAKGIDRVQIGNRTYTLYCRKREEFTYDVWINHAVIRVTVEDIRARLLGELGKQAASSSGPQMVRAPMPGLVVSIEARQGEIVQQGQGLLILEAMKMENEIRSPLAGRIEKVGVSDRATVEKGQVLMVVVPVEVKHPTDNDERT